MFLAKLLHAANSSPPGPREQRDLFYAMKSRLLHRFAIEDGFDLQEIPGKICFGCDGGGIFYHWSGDGDTCFRCGGSGWYRSPRYVSLKRWRLGEFTFHEPIKTSYENPKIEPTIKGYVRHKVYPYRQITRAQLLLAIAFDWKLARLLLLEDWKYSRLKAFFCRRCIDCERRLWSWSRWRCSSCLHVAQSNDAQRVAQSNDTPF